MSHISLLNKPILDLIPENVESVIDVACGYGEWGFLIKTRKHCQNVVGVDIWKPYLNKLQKLNAYDNLIRVKLPFLPFRDNSFQLCLACEILEHLTETDGFVLLEELDRVSNSLVIISTPLNYPQDAIEQNVFEIHRAEWSKETLEKCGFKVLEVKTLPKTLQIVDNVRRLLTRLGPAPKFLIG